jgi:hypothetical protein
MRNAVADRLRDVIRHAQQLLALVDADRALPGMLLCRLGIDADHAANVLAEHAERLGNAGNHCSKDLAAKVPRTEDLHRRWKGGDC